MTNGDEIKAARLAKGLSQRALAEIVGCSQPAIKGIEDDTSKDSKYEGKVRKFLGLKPKLSFDDVAPAPLTPPEGEVFGPRTLRLYAAAEGGPGEMVVSNEPIEFLPRPWYLGAVEGYAVLVVGESMVPAFRPGHIAIINPKLPTFRGYDYLFRQDREDGTFLGTIKHLVKVTRDEWCVEQFNPPEGDPRTFGLLKTEWVPHRIVGRYDP